MPAASPQLIPGRKLAPARLGRVLVLGLGKSGRAAADYLLPLLGGRVELVAIAAGVRTEASEAFAASARERGAAVEFGDGAPASLAKAAGGRFDLCIASPGISQFSPFYESAAAASDEVASEVEFAWRESAVDSRWVAVTGTNGKTTTSALAAHVLRAGGLRAEAVGNIGDVCLEAVGADAADVYVAEVSSYQLASTSRFAPDAAVLLNITPDHLSWHKSFEAYRAAKLKVLQNLGTTGGTAVLNAADDEVRTVVRGLRAMAPAERGFSYVPLGTAAGISGDMRAACGSDNAAFLGDDGQLRVALGGGEHALMRAADLQIKGEHNVANALAAAAAALSLGESPDDVARGLATFAPLEHRIEPCGSVAGVACFNDSKATNVDAVLAALTAFPNVRPVVLLGGDDKGTDLAPLVAACQASAKAVVCFGAAGSRFVSAFGGVSSTDVDQGDLLVLSANHLEDALDAALSVARAGDAVLLSPACASFDEFTSYEERGRAFKRLVAERAAARGA